MTLVSSQCRCQEPHPYSFWSLLGYAPLLVLASPNLRTVHPFFLLIGDSVWSHLQTAIIYTQFLQVDPVIPFTLATGAALIPAHISRTLQLQCEKGIHCRCFGAQRKPSLSSPTPSPAVPWLLPPSPLGQHQRRF